MGAGQSQQQPQQKSSWSLFSSSPAPTQGAPIPPPQFAQPQGPGQFGGSRKSRKSSKNLKKGGKRKTSSKKK
jgi:hypothetical protein